jgi:hypothetical protein
VGVLGLLERDQTVLERGHPLQGPVHQRQEGLSQDTGGTRQRLLLECHNEDEEGDDDGERGQVVEEEVLEKDYGGQVEFEYDHETWKAQYFNKEKEEDAREEDTTTDKSHEDSSEKKKKKKKKKKTKKDKKENGNDSPPGDE